MLLSNVYSVRKLGLLTLPAYTNIKVNHATSSVITNATPDQFKKRIGAVKLCNLLTSYDSSDVSIVHIRKRTAIPDCKTIVT